MNGIDVSCTAGPFSQIRRKKHGKDRGALNGIGGKKGWAMPLEG